MSDLHEPNRGWQDHQDRLVRLETQVSRIVSDIESEKETRARSSVAFDRKLDESTVSRNVRFDKLEERFDKQDERLRKQDLVIYAVGGALALVQFIAPIAAQLFHK
jgi:hypothetical protein